MHNIISNILNNKYPFIILNIKNLHKKKFEILFYFCAHNVKRLLFVSFKTFFIKVLTLLFYFPFAYVTFFEQFLFFRIQNLFILKIFIFCVLYFIY